MGYYLAIKRNKCESVRWMNPEPVMQNEVSQKEKNKYCITVHIDGIQKNCIDEPVSRAGVEMQT